MVNLIHRYSCNFMPAGFLVRSECLLALYWHETLAHEYLIHAGSFYLSVSLFDLFIIQEMLSCVWIVNLKKFIWFLLQKTVLHVIAEID